MSSPNFKVFPLAGFARCERYYLTSKSKLCPEISFTDDFLAARGEYTHNANDIFTCMRVQVVAPTDGLLIPGNFSNLKIKDKADDWSYFEDGGWHYYLLGDDGFIYYGAHLDTKPVKRPGQRVIAGELIGYVGRSGNTAGCPHLHFAMYRTTSTGAKGAPVNPYQYIKATKPFSLPTALRTGLSVTGVGLGAVLLIGGGYLFIRWLKNRHRGR